MYQFWRRVEVLYQININCCVYSMGRILSVIKVAQQIFNVEPLVRNLVENGLVTSDTKHEDRYTLYIEPVM
jgi:hypothetical protein